ncbi:hypothetical protein [Sinorhizobium fredii]|uniref:hypothetical protein n=1 Tax=Rhizobium fredii TaxID=380 RepID=UPI001F2D07B7|nr:hypothetical protein [Sinorhizobium fredii]
MIEEPSSADASRKSGRCYPARCPLRFVARLPLVIFVGIARALLYSAWYLAFYVFCMFRPLTGMMILAAIVIVPMSIVVFANLDAANGMSFWAFALMMIGLVAIALAIRCSLPGLLRRVDPFARYRSDRR